MYIPISYSLPDLPASAGQHGMNFLPKKVKTIEINVVSIENYVHLSIFC